MKIFIELEVKNERVRDYVRERDFYDHTYSGYISSPSPLYTSVAKSTYSVYFNVDEDASVSSDDVLAVYSTEADAMTFAKKLQAGTGFEIVTNFARPIEFKVIINATSVEEAIEKISIASLVKAESV